MLDPTGFVALDLSQRLTAKQFSEQEIAPKTQRVKSTEQPLRARFARALRRTADALEPTPDRRTAS